MFIAGQARTLIDLQELVNGVDANGAPVRTYTSHVQCYAMTEARRADVNDSTDTGPREESVKTLTLIVRNHASLNINTRMRVNVVGTGEYYNITAIRYDASESTCYIDCTGGQANG